jgi:UDP-N-acetylmuramate--alanine ligase
MKNAKNVHIIGIGGIGTSAVARYFVTKGAEVSGSDMHPSSIIDDLSKEDVRVKIGHFADNIPRECDLVVYSRAVPATNVERQAAVERGITEVSYPQFIGALAKEYKTIAISGTNGKSTTTAMVARILIDAGLDPTVIIGTLVPGWEKKNLRVGKGDWLIVEACEHLASMLEISPDIAVITNIEEDHLDFYKDLDDIRGHFQTWVDGIKNGGSVVLNAQDGQSDMLKTSNAVKFDARDDLNLAIPGSFNMMNASAAIKVAEVIGVDEDVAKAAVEGFEGTWRRFEYIGQWQDADVYSDYAHHPTAVKGSISAFKEKYPDRRLVVCFQPHQYSRTAELFDDFVTSFEETDVLILSEVYEVAGRNEDKSKTSKDLVDAIKEHGKPDQVMYAGDIDEAESKLRDVVEKGDIIVFMGAGDIDTVARKLAS